MITQSFPVYNGGVLGTLLQMYFQASDNGQLQQCVVQSGFPAATTYPGIIADGRNSLVPFVVLLGQGQVSFTVQPGQYFSRQIPAIQNLTVTLTWIGTPGIQPGTNGPCLSFTTYDVIPENYASSAAPFYELLIVGPQSVGFTSIFGATGRMCDLTILNNSSANAVVEVSINIETGGALYYFQNVPANTSVITKVWDNMNIPITVASIEIVNENLPAMVAVITNCGG